MPYSPEQNRLFRAAAHNRAVADAHGLSQAKARDMATEGVKSPQGGVKKAQALAKGLMKRK